MCRWPHYDRWLFPTVVERGYARLAQEKTRHGCSKGPCMRHPPVAVAESVEGVHVGEVRLPLDVLLEHVRLHHHPQVVLSPQEVEHLHERPQQLVAQLHYHHDAANTSVCRDESVSSAGVELAIG